MQKLITFAVPCYNSAAYMDHCVETLLSAGERGIEIILVDDGSTKDDTPAICDRYAAQYPTIVQAIHQENGGHGEGVNQGIRNAPGLYYKVVDSDDWLDERRPEDRAGQAALSCAGRHARGPDDLQLRLRACGGQHPAGDALHQRVPREPAVQLGCRSAASAPPSTC